MRPKDVVVSQMKYSDGLRMGKTAAAIVTAQRLSYLGEISPHVWVTASEVTYNSTIPWTASCTKCLRSVAFEQFDLSEKAAPKAEHAAT